MAAESEKEVRMIERRLGLEIGGGELALPQEVAVRVHCADGHHAFCPGPAEAQRSVVPNAHHGAVHPVVVGFRAVVVAAAGQSTAGKIQDGSATR